MLAASSRALADRTTGRQGFVEYRAHGGVHETQKETQIGTAADFDEGSVLMNVLSSVLLLLMFQQIRHHRRVVRQIEAEINRNGLASSVMLEVYVLVLGYVESGRYYGRPETA